MKCLIVAAGQGARLREKGELKPLIPIRGVALIERVIGQCRAAGAEEFFVVSGYRGGELRQTLDELAARDAIRITHVVNEQWERANGVSVLAAKSVLHAPFLLTMCDHLVDPEILRRLIAVPVEPDTVRLAVDFNLERPFNDPDDVTRVKCVAGRIAHIGKVIRDYNAFDTGVFVCTQAMFTALEASQMEGDDTISGAINMLARWGQARIFDIGSRIWIDVDDPAAFAKAEALLDQGRL
jgi:1L-myo-inositol 1-phosphate cytidylyltransferase